VFVALVIQHANHIHHIILSSVDFLKILKYHITWKSIQWGPSCSMQTDGWTDRHDKANTHLP